MDEVKTKKIEELKMQIIRKMKSCIDDRGVLNISEFRINNPKEYSKIPMCFGSVDKAMEVVGAVKLTNQKSTPTLKMMLAYDYIKLMIEQGNSLGAIANQYGVDRANINQLYNSLKKAIENEK